LICYILGLRKLLFLQLLLPLNNISHFLIIILNQTCRYFIIGRSSPLIWGFTYLNRIDIIIIESWLKLLCRFTKLTSHLNRYFLFILNIYIYMLFYNLIKFRFGKELLNIHIEVPAIIKKNMNNDLAFRREFDLNN